MIQEATKNARIAAEQFSKDSQTDLGKLRNASHVGFKLKIATLPPQNARR
jgi:hypothetical protein